ADAESALELRNRGGTAVFTPESDDELVDLALPPGELHTVSIYTIRDHVNRAPVTASPDPFTALNEYLGNPSALRCVYGHLDGKSLSGSPARKYLVWGLSLSSLVKTLISLAIGATVFGQSYTIQTIAGGA